MSDTPIDRGGFLHALAERLTSARADGSTVGLALVDVRKFHRINQMYGLAAGDALLAHVGDRLGQVWRRSPFVRRVGNDEFGVIFSGIANAELLALIGSKLVREIGDALLVRDSEINFDLDVGLAAFPQGADSADQLFCRAEQALRLARDSGAPYVVDAPENRREEQHDWRLELELQEALSSNALQLWYQPAIDLRRNCPGRPEALLRWNSSAQGEISPDRFIPMIEQGGRSLELARWVLNTALRHSQQWGELGVGVNLSAAVLRNADVVEMVRSALRIWSVPPGQLTIEVAESALARDQDMGVRLLQPLREAGVRIALDDFGAGHSSLLQFRSVPADEIKLDRGMVAGVARERADRILCEHAVALAHGFERSVTAVGVEDQRAIDVLRTLGCDAVQGFRIARPMSEGDFRQWAQSAQRLAGAG